MRRKTIDTIPNLSNNIESILSKFINSRSISSGLAKRAKIILLASRGLTNQDIAKRVGLHYNLVGIWRTRFLKAIPTLLEVEAANPDKLREEVRLVLSDLKRSGAPTVFTAEQIVKIIDLACKNPADFGYEASHWSLPLLTKEIKKQGIAEQISEKTVSRFLKMR